MSLSAQLQPEVLNEVVDRIVQAVRPQRMVLFGSAATGRMGPDSDLDLLVIMPDGIHRRRTAQAIYSSLRGSASPRISWWQPRATSKTTEIIPRWCCAQHSGKEESSTVPQDRPIRGSPQEWLARARGDLALARAPLPLGDFYEDLCLHAQQAAEKALKAVYLHCGWTFRYVHDLEELITGLQQNGLRVPEAVEDAVVLTS